MRFVLLGTIMKKDNLTRLIFFMVGSGIGAWTILLVLLVFIVVHRLNG